MEKEEFNLNETIGRIITNHSLIEFMLANWVAELINKDYVIGKIVTCEMSCNNLLQAFQSLMQYESSRNKIYENHFPDIKNLVMKIRIAEQEEIQLLIL
jgi:hypothetical protein